MKDLVKYLPLKENALLGYKNLTGDETQTRQYWSSISVTKML